MFLPQNMTEDEKNLAAQIARQLLAQQQPSTDQERQIVRHQAEEIAAEMIWEARGEATSETDEDDEELTEYERLDLELHERSAEQMAQLDLEEQLQEQEEMERDRKLAQQENGQPPAS